MAAEAPRRVDAARNDETILAGAMQALSLDPAAGMGEIAEACELSRMTLHRRYATREDLVTRLRQVAHTTLRGAVESAELERGSAQEALGRLCDSLLSVGEQYAFLDQAANASGERDGVTGIAGQISRLVERGQADGSFDACVPVEWATELIAGVLRQATAEARRSSHDSAVGLMTLTLRRALQDSATDSRATG